MNRKAFVRRIYFSGAICAFVMLLFTIKFFRLHFSDKVVVPPRKEPQYHRGYIQDRNGRFLALSIEQKSLFANPEEIISPEDTATFLAPVIKRPRNLILNRLKKKKRFVWLKRKLDEKRVLRIEQARIRGLYFRKEYKRVYPHERMAASLLGFVSVDNMGLSGVEYLYNGILSGEDLSYFSSIDSGLVHGRNIRLTIDSLAQNTAEKALKKTVAAFNARQAVAVVLQVKTGRILAYAKLPSFNPNSYYSFSPQERRNSLFIDSFEPGSTVKVLSTAALIEHAPQVFKRTYTCTGSIDIADETINCTGRHGTVDMYDSLKHSCNVGIISACKSLKRNDLYGMLRRFGFGQKTGLELPGESSGILRPVAKWSGLSKFSIAIGYELSVNSIQLAAAFAAIANDGIYLKPTVIESIEDVDGSILHSFSPKTKGRVIQKRTARTLMKMMQGVITGGTGQRARVFEYTALGKTGTSNKYSIQGREYSDRVISSFVGIAPAKNPELCILVVVDEPAGKESGGRAAAPVFSDIAERLLPIYGAGVPPKRAGAVKRSVKRKYILKGAMPDFRGRTLSDILHALQRLQVTYGTTVSVKGTGRIYSQSPRPGQKLKPGTKIYLNLSEE